MNPDDFYARMFLVAEANDDEFHIWFSYKFPVWTVHIQETADRHMFLEATGSNPEEAMLNAWNNLGDSCKIWSYKVPVEAQHPIGYFDKSTPDSSPQRSER